MTSLDLLDLLSRAETDLARLQRSLQADTWQAARQGRPPDDHSAGTAIDRLLANEEVLMRLEAAYRREGTDRVTKRRAAWWLSWALSREAARQCGQAARLRQIAAIAESYQGTVGRDRPKVDALVHILAHDRDRSRREQAYVSLTSLARSLASLSQETIAELAAAWTPSKGTSRGTSLWQQPLSPFQLDWPGVVLPELVDEFLQGTEAILEQFHHVAERAVQSRSLRPWDIEFAIASLAQPYDQYFPPQDHGAALGRALRACGLPTDSLPLTVNSDPAWLPISHCGWPRVEWLVTLMHRQLPGANHASRQAGLPRPDAGLLVDGSGSAQESLSALATALGVAVGALHNLSGHLGLRTIAGGVDPAAMVVASLVTEPNYLAGQTQMPRSEVAAHLALGSQRSGTLRGVRLRILAARAMVAWRLFEDPAQDPGALLAHWYWRATGVHVDGRLVALDFATLIEPLRWPVTFLSELAGGQVVGHLRQEHGKVMGDRRTAECLIECFWRAGALIPATSGLAMATGKEIAPGAEIAALKAAVGL